MNFNILPNVNKNNKNNNNDNNQFDFDINNYTKSELLYIFKLDDNYTNEEFEKNEEILKKIILNSNHDYKYKY